MNLWWKSRISHALAIQNENTYEVEEVSRWKMLNQKMISFSLEIEKFQNSTQVIFCSVLNFWQLHLFLVYNSQREIDHWNQHLFGKNICVTVANFAIEHTSCQKCICQNVITIRHLESNQISTSGNGTHMHEFYAQITELPPHANAPPATYVLCSSWNETDAFECG